MATKRADLDPDDRPPMLAGKPVETYPSLMGDGIWTCYHGASLVGVILDDGGAWLPLWIRGSEERTWIQPSIAPLDSRNEAALACAMRG